VGLVACRKDAVEKTWQDHGDRLLAENARRLSPLA